MVETADREKAETEYARQIEGLEIRRDEELGPLKEKLITEEEQVTLLWHKVSMPLYTCSTYYTNKPATPYDVLKPETSNWTWNTIECKIFTHEHFTSWVKKD